MTRWRKEPEGGRVGVLHLRASRGLYGAERAILDLAAGCRSQGVSSALAVLMAPHRPQHELLQAAERLGLRTFPLRSDGARDARAVVRLLNLLRLLRPRVLHVHGYKAQVHALLARPLLRPLGVPVPALVATHHGDTAQDLRVRAYEALARSLLRRVDHVIAVSSEGAGLLRRDLPQEAVTLIPNGVDVAGIELRLAQARRHEQRAALRRRLGLPPDSVVLLALGRLSPEKGHRALLKAVAGLPSPRPAVLIAGEGPLEAELKAQAAAGGVELVLPGFIHDPAPLWYAADLLCQPSLREGLPLAVLEAMAAGLPVVASHVGEIGGVLGLGAGLPPELQEQSRRLPTRVKVGSAGLLVPPGDAELLGAALGLLASPDAAPSRAALASAARSRVLASYDLSLLVRMTMEQVYLPLAPNLVRGDDSLSGNNPAPARGAS